MIVDSIELTFEQVYHSHKNSIYRLCKLMVHQPSQIDDLFQEVSVNLWKSLPAFRRQAAISTWIYRIVVNTSITFNNKQLRRLNHKREYIKEQEVSNGETKDESAVELLMKAAAQLKDVDRVVLGLYLEGFSYKEMAEVLGVSVTNIGVKVNRIKERLKKNVHKREAHR